MSRLEEIKRAYNYPHCNEKGYPKWLIERVEELETSREEIAECYREDWKQNNRYKRALKEIAFHAVFGGVDWNQEYHELKIIARKALEESE